jgi:hypothetical protein
MPKPKAKADAKDQSLIQMPKPKAKADAGDRGEKKTHISVGKENRRLHFPHILIKPKKIENTQNKWRIKTFHSAIHLQSLN